MRYTINIRLCADVLPQSAVQALILMDTIAIPRCRHDGGDLERVMRQVFPDEESVLRSMIATSTIRNECGANISLARMRGGC